MRPGSTGTEQRVTRAPWRLDSMERYFRPTSTLFLAMALMLPCVALFSTVRIGEGDLPGTDFYVFPFLHHGYGETPRSFYPGSWAANFLIPSYLISVVFNTLRRSEPAAITVSALFFYLWAPLTAIVDVAADTLVPILVSRHRIPFVTLAIAVNAALAGGVAVATAFARGSEGDW